MTRNAVPIALAVLGSYLLGGFCAAYYVVRMARSTDIRTLGSGNAGARNAGRLLGAPGFLVTLLLDAAKGAVAVWVTARLVPGPWPETLSLLAVVAGHIWPAQLGWRGGKGIATALGGLVAWLPTVGLGNASAALPSAVVAIALPAMTLWAHRANLAKAGPGLDRPKAARVRRAEDGAVQGSPRSPGRRA
jgi:acyl-phosphate glycerol 3-phosphate acyltransferase